MICVDASVAVKWILVEELRAQADALYLSARRAGSPIVAPSLMLFEVTNIIRRRMRRDEGMSLVVARQALEDFLAIGIEVRSPLGLHQLALAIAADYNLPTAYDAHYLALADMLGCEFWTADVRLLRQVEAGLRFVRWLGDYTPAGEA